MSAKHFALACSWCCSPILVLKRWQIVYNWVWGNRIFAENIRYWCSYAPWYDGKHDNTFRGLGYHRSDAPLTFHKSPCMGRTESRVWQLKGDLSTLVQQLNNWQQVTYRRLPFAPMANMNRPRLTGCWPGRVVAPSVIASSPLSTFSATISSFHNHTRKFLTPLIKRCLEIKILY